MQPSLRRIASTGVLQMVHVEFREVTDGGSARRASFVPVRVCKGLGHQHVFLYSVPSSRRPEECNVHVCRDSIEPNVTRISMTWTYTDLQ